MSCVRWNAPGAPGPPSVPHYQRGHDMEEKSFFNRGNVSVSNARFIVDGQTYTMHGVTSVKTGRQDPSRTAPVVVGLIGLGMLASGETGLIIFGIALIALAVFWWKYQKPTLSVVLSSSSGEAQALSSQDASYINDVVSALNNAIVERG